MEHKDQIFKSDSSFAECESTVSPLAILKHSIQKELDEANVALDDIIQFISREAPGAVQLQRATKKGFRLVVDASQETLEAIDKGNIKLTTDRWGNTFAQIKQPNGEFGKKLPIKREDFSQGIDPVQAANSIQMKAIQDQLESLAEQIAIIDGRVREVLQGQHSDRIGLFQSGMALYLEAREIQDNDLKKLLVSQALKALSDSYCQLSLELQNHIRYLENKEFDKEKGKRVKLIDEKMQEVNRCFPAVHQAAIAKAAVYCEQGEMRAMATTLDEYAHFIESTVGGRAGLLAEYDIADDGADKGLWRSRAALRLDVSEFGKALMAPEKVLYLEMVEEQD